VNWHSLAKCGEVILWTMENYNNYRDMFIVSSVCIFLFTSWHSLAKCGEVILWTMRNYNNYRDTFIFSSVCNFLFTSWHSLAKSGEVILWTMRNYNNYRDMFIVSSVCISSFKALCHSSFPSCIAVPNQKAKSSIFGEVQNKLLCFVIWLRKANKF
jgi:hypothetical protein